MISTIFSILIIGFVTLLAGMVIAPIFFGAPWHPLPASAIKRILAFAELRPGEKFYDLGSGDGRVLIAAAKDYGTEGVGVEIDPLKIGLSRWLVRRRGLADHIRIFRGNVYAFDYREADILYIYMTHQALDRLFPDLLNNLKPSARIICYRFCIRGIAPAKVNADKTLFMYRGNKGKEVNTFS